MDAHHDRASRVQRVDPSIAEPDQGLHVCIECRCELVNPVEWEKSGPETWRVLLQCPNCDVYRSDIVSDENLEAFDEELARGAEALTGAYESLVRENMSAEIDRFVRALRADAILPEDF